jgi:hypothetical protein
MPPDTRVAALPHELLARICSHLPPGDAILTVPRLNKALAAAAAPRVAELRAGAAVLEEDCLYVGVELFSIPLWALQEAWPQLSEGQRTRSTARAVFHGDLATLRWALPQREDEGTF